MTNTPPRRSTAQIILQTIQDLHCAEQIVTREVLRKVTGLSLSIIDDHIKRMVGIGQLHRVVNGVFIPVDAMSPARAISTTYLPDGFVKLEVGNDCMDLTPREARMLGRALAGHALEFSNIQAGYEAVATRSARYVADKKEAQDKKAANF